MNDDQIIDWLLDGDVSIQYQVRGDLLGRENERLRGRIAREGWGGRFLALRRADGHWGRAFYQPKWTSTHYTLLDLKNLGITPTNREIRQTLGMLLATHKAPDGGIYPVAARRSSDLCLDGMFLNYASYFGMPEEDLRSIVDLLLAQQLGDGGFNCEYNRREVSHSSMHTTISVLEGIAEYARNGYTYRLQELLQAECEAQEFLLGHRLFRSHRAGTVIDPKWLRLSYPSRWRYDILRALDYFRLREAPYDTRMEDAVEELLKKRGKDGRWRLPAPHPGQTHFEMEETGKPSRWNTLRALRVLKYIEAAPSASVPLN